jgi:hypothetical protein
MFTEMLSAGAHAYETAVALVLKVSHPQSSENACSADRYRGVEGGNSKKREATMGQLWGSTRQRYYFSGYYSYIPWITQR